MPKHSQEYLCEFSVSEIYNLILDVEQYPEFLPWCTDAQIVDRNDDKLIADLSITFKYLTETYRSEIKIKPTDHESETFIEVNTISGPFEYLHNTWHLQSIAGGTLIKFHIDFCFKSVVLQKIIGIFFNKACEKMLDAFIKRANKLYGE